MGPCSVDLAAYSCTKHAHSPWLVAYLGGGVRCDAPPLARPWKFFTGDFIWKGAFFAVFQQISEKMGEFAASIERSKAKSVSASGGLRPPTLDHGLCPWTPLGAPPPDPRYRLALCARAMAPLCQILRHWPWLVIMLHENNKKSSIQLNYWLIFLAMLERHATQFFYDHFSN